MKSYIKLFVMSGLLAGAASCTDLDTEIVTQYTTFPDNPIAVSGEFEGCYYYHRSEGMFGRNYWEGAYLSGDEAVGVNWAGVYYDNGRHVLPAIHDYNPDVPGIGFLGDMMSGCTYTNQRILVYGGAEGKDPIVAPLRAIRAFYHFWMMDFYGDVPILDHIAQEGEAIERMPRAEVAQFIEQELLDVIPDLSEANDATTYGRPNKWMAEALLVKLYLNWGVYTHDILTVDNNTPNEKLNDCVKWCNELIKSGVFEVGKGYRKKFYPDNGVQIKDFIYAVPFDPVTLGYGYWGGHQMVRFVDFRMGTYLKPYIWSWKPETSRAGVWILTPEAVDRFCLEGDERNEMIQCGQAYAYDTNFNLTTDSVFIYTDANRRKNKTPFEFKKEFDWAVVKTLDVGEETAETCAKGARCYKYPANYINDTYAAYIWQENDIPVFRYADVLLTKAECILRGATDDMGQTPAALINEVRDCASAPHITNVTFDELLDERSRELILEPWRRNDLIRFGKFENCAKWKVAASPSTMADKNKRLYPIPSGIMNTNTNWSQNPSYATASAQ